LSAHEPPVGTSFLPAVEMALQQPPLENRTELDFLFITDGDDLAQDAQRAAERMRTSGHRWHLYGIGDPDQPARIPSGDPQAPFVLIDDPDSPTPKPATTQRRDAILQAMARTAQARLRLEDGSPQPLVRWWQEEIQSCPPAPWLADARLLREHQGGWFLLAALLLLLVEGVWGDGTFRPGFGE
jgi:hypothetical protein